MPTEPQPWYSSKTLWTLVLMFAFNMLQHFHVLGAGANTEFYANAVLAILAIVFRWKADQPLTLKGGTVNK